MFEQFTADARTVVVLAQVHARRLGHDYLGCEHLLLAVCSIEGEVGRDLRASGVTPAAVEAATLRILGTGGGLDREALAAIGIDLDAVRKKVEASFGPDALNRWPRRVSRRRWGRRRRCESGPSHGHLRFTARAKSCLEMSLGEAKALQHHHIGAEHLALALTAMTAGPVPEVFRTLGVSSAHLRTEILNRHRRAG